MADAGTMLILASIALIGLGLASAAALRGWRGWLDLKRLELTRAPVSDPAPPSTAARIELADLKERVRKLEAIANGVEL